MTSLSRAIRSQSQEIVEFVIFGPMIFLNCARACDLMFQLQIIIEKRTADLLTPSTTFYDVSVACNLFTKAEMRQFGASGNTRI